jgi:hypothetical protein
VGPSCAKERDRDVSCCSYDIATRKLELYAMLPYSSHSSFAAREQHDFERERIDVLTMAFSTCLPSTFLAIHPSKGAPLSADPPAPRW